MGCWEASEEAKGNEDGTVGDFFAVAGDEAQSRLKELGSPWFSENDMFFLVERSGVDSGIQSKPKLDVNAANMTPEEIENDNKD